MKENMNRVINKNLLIYAVKNEMRKNRDTQLTLSEQLDIGQSHISKILNGHFTRSGYAIRKLVEYSKYNEYLPKLHHSKKIQDAVMQVWDGSEEMEIRIARTIKEVGNIWMNTATNE
ncbi:MAG: helix-turn-helix domain-containing protein [Bacteroidales bacterium]|nr:helix-turn-helix domain-containing protein [Bacteroidales bacterium]